jgi:hypothetical protein
MGNRDWRQYQEWLADGNTVDPEYTQQEIAKMAKVARKLELKNKITRGNTKPLKLVLEILAIVKEHIPEATLTPEMETQVQEWIADLAEIEEIDNEGE